MTGPQSTGPLQPGPLDPDYERKLAKQAAVAALVAVQQARGAAESADGQDQGPAGEAVAGPFASPARAVRRGRAHGTWARRL